MNTQEHDKLIQERDSLKAELEKATLEAAAIWSATCVHHTDAQRDSISCPVCLKAALEKARDAAMWIIADPACIHLSEASRAFLRAMRGDDKNVYDEMRTAPEKERAEAERLKAVLVKWSADTHGPEGVWDQLHKSDAQAPDLRRQLAEARGTAMANDELCGPCQTRSFDIRRPDSCGSRRGR